jgi:hypothetical protein
MKQLLFFLSFFLVITLSNAQYTPTLVDNATWINHDIGFGFDVWREMHITSDTTLNGLIYRKVDPVSGFGGYSYLREDTVSQQIYQLDESQSFVEYLIYDYSLSIGDTFFSALYPDTLIVTAIDTVLNFGTSTCMDLDSTYRKIISLSFINSNYGVLTWIEGIGSLDGLVYTGNTRLHCFINDNGLRAFHNTCEAPYFYNSDTCFTGVISGIEESKSQNISIYPNPFLEQLNIEFTESYHDNFEVRIFDILNREITVDTQKVGNLIQLGTSFLKSGVYIVQISVENKVLERIKVIKK